jgi:predicted DCC family thiol-disulfide oxidoreductase YuxK
MKTKVRVFYNSACPVCKAGIANQRDKTTACSVEWLDIHHDKTLKNEINAGIENIREQLHVIDEKGQMQVGVNAFEVLWRNSPTEHWKAKLVANAFIKPFARFAYFIFARLLYKWNRFKKHW